MTDHGIPLVGQERLVDVRVCYRPRTGAVQVIGGDATADEVLVALVKAAMSCLLQAVHLVP